ncbi:MAG: hypothetical protein SF339_20195 [Blastocatellia bacterium]|nr:hypothetical protein [Blastocatellia bacterium]
MKTVLALLMLVLSTGAFAQAPAPAAITEGKRLEFLVGEWKGEGWMELGPGNRKTFVQSESVQRKLGGTLLMIEGVGKSGETIVHNALALISFDAKSNGFVMRAYRADGNWIDPQISVAERSLLWGFKDPRFGVEIKYTINVTEAGQWVEIGEMSRDGKAWRQFFEMKLQRK